MRFDDVLDDRKTEPRTARAARTRPVDDVEPFEDMRQRIEWDSRPVILHVERHEAAREREPDFDVTAR